MAERPEEDDEKLELPPLKFVEPELNTCKPWIDDKLNRKRVADRLTEIVADQKAPYVISLDGRWGTGKTFLLKRWHQALTINDYQAIYFNAWEDDFCDDPMLAIIGQLSEWFDGGDFEALATKVVDIGLQLLSKQLIGTAISFESLKTQGVLNDYREQIRTKQELKSRIRSLAGEVAQETGRPLVFIIDELDRCRPTFAIELLERVKHIFDSPNVVFVFGINRRELSNSLRSVYGEIDATVYLRRFFDMEFVLPDADAGKFCAHLMEVYGLDTYFTELGRDQGANIHVGDLRTASSVLPLVFGIMGLSLRDIDYCMRFVALAGRRLKPRQTIFPVILASLVAVKISNPGLYRRFVEGKARAAELVDYMNQLRGSVGSMPTLPGVNVRWRLDFLEASLYFADDVETAMRQVQLLQAGKPLDRPEFLAIETRELDPDSDVGKKRIDNLLRVFERLDQQSFNIDHRASVPHLAELVDLFDRDAVIASGGR